MIKYGTNNIGKIYFGSNPIKKAYLGSNLVYQSGGGPGPGPGPQPTGIAYIRGGADGSYIDTGITADNTVKVIVWARNWNPTSGFIFGSRVATTQDTFGLGAHSAQNTGRIRIDYNQGQTFADDQFANLSHYHKYELYQGVLKVDDVVQASATDGAFSNNVNIHLLGVNTSGTHANPGLPIDICACQIYKGGNLVRDYTAVNTPSAGLYDAVSDTLFTNAGSGSFTYGSFNQNAYIPLEYIQCTHAQYFDTGIYGKGDMQVSVKFRAVGTDVSYPTIFGCNRDNVTGSYFILQLSNASYPNRYANFHIDTSTANQMYNNNSNRLTGRDIVFYKDATSCQLAENHTLIGSKKTFSVSASLTTLDTLALGTGQSNGTMSADGAFNGYLYYAGFGTERNFVPAKVNNVAGMYDTFNDTFYPSTSGTAFIAGSEL